MVVEGTDQFGDLGHGVHELVARNAGEDRVAHAAIGTG
jgi:hypothetical protein